MLANNRQGDNKQTSYNKQGVTTMETENMVKKMIEQWIKEHQDEKEKARKKRDYWTEIMEREDNYISYLKTMLNEK